MASYAHYIARGMAMAGRVARLGQGHITVGHGLSGYFYMLADGARQSVVLRKTIFTGKDTRNVRR